MIINIRATHIALFAATTFGLLSAHDAAAISIRADRTDAQYTGLAAPFDAVGRFDFGGFIGSGTLVANNKILTAAHNFDDNGDGMIDGGLSLSNYTFSFGPNADAPTHQLTLSSADTLTIHPSWNSSRPAGHDMAVVMLASPFNDIGPIQTHLGSAAGQTGTSVGYGVHGTGAPPFENLEDGLRRAMNNLIDRHDSLIETDFDSPAGDTSTTGSNMPLDLEGTTGGGDSGGPILADFGGTDFIVGVLHGGVNPFGGLSEYGDISTWAPINDTDNLSFLRDNGINPVPVPAAVWLFGSAIAGLAGLQARRRKTA